jgi:hypothetical protein
MQPREANTFENITLAQNAVAVSKNISIKLNIGLNDYLFIDTSYKNIDKYVVSHIIDYSYGTFFDPFSDWGLIIMGNEIDFINNINVKYICFSDVPLQKLDVFVLNSIDDINEILTIDNLKLHAMFTLFKYFLSYIFLLFIIYLVIKRIYDSYWERYLSMLSQLGFSSINIMSIILILSLLRIFIPLLMGYLINIFFNISININHMAIFSTITLCFLFSLAWCIICYRIFRRQVRFKYG